MEYFENEDAIKTVNIIELSKILEDQRKNYNKLKKIKKIENCHGLVYKKLKEKSRIFISPELGREIIERVHEHYGHIGPPYMISIHPYYYFQNLDKMVHDYCAKCQICKKNKVRKGKAIGLLS